jgi:hypothetical protein
MNPPRAFIRVAVLLVATMLTGCASKEQIATHVETTERPVVANEMAEVVARVTPADLAECKQLVERPSALGAKMTLAGPLKPNAQSTCVAMDTLVRDRTKKIAAYTAPVRTEGVARLSGAKIFGCIMVLENGKVTVQRGAPFKSRLGSVCHLMRS